MVLLVRAKNSFYAGVLRRELYCTIPLGDYKLPYFPLDNKTDPAFFLHAHLLISGFFFFCLFVLFFQCRGTMVNELCEKIFLVTFY